MSKRRASSKNPASKRSRRRATLFSRGVDVSDAPPAPAAAQSAQQRALLLRAMDRSVLGSAALRAHQQAIADRLQPLTLSAGQGVPDDPPAFFVIESGGVSLRGQVEELGAGDSFGEYALLSPEKARPVAALAMARTRLWTLRATDFRRVVARAVVDGLVQRVNWVRNVDLLASLSQRQLVAVAASLESREYAPGACIVREGDVGETFFLIESGEVACYQQRDDPGDNGQYGVEVARRFAGDYFGEAALLQHEPRTASVVATGAVTCLCLSVQDFNSLLGPLSEVMEAKASMRTLRAVEALGDVSARELEMLVSAMHPCDFDAGAAVDLSTHVLFVVKRGAVRLDSGAVVRAGYCFGELAGGAAASAAAAVAVERVRCVALSRAEWAATHSSAERQESLLGEERAAKAARVSSLARHPMEALDEVAVIGTGSFSTVALVRYQADEPPGAPELFMALKKMSKGHIAGCGQVEHVLNERNLLHSMDPHPFILKLYATYQDDDTLYLLTEFIQGGELFTLCHTYDCTSQMAASFYAANVVLGLAHLHAQDIVYRDLKPENLLLDASGYLKFIDFGFATRCPRAVNGVVQLRTFTLCGTPEYVAPECVLGVGHDQGVDYWAVGVLIYELILQTTPFQSPSGDPREVFQRILDHRERGEGVAFPDGFAEAHPHAADVVRQLLHGTPSMRLGVRRGGVADLQRHPWFALIDWARLEQQELAPPHVPTIASPFDLSHFAPAAAAPPSFSAGAGAGASAVDTSGGADPFAEF